MASDYDLAVQKLSDLNKHLEDFLNLDKDSNVNTSAGQIPSLRRVIEGLKRIQYVQKLKSFPTLTDAFAALENIVESDLVQVTGGLETGLYKKTEIDETTYTLDKVDYADLYDLGNKLPSPWNYQTFEYTGTNSSVEVFTASIEKSAIVNYFDELTGTIKFKSDDIFYTADFKLRIRVYAESSVVQINFYPYNVYSVGATGTVPSLDVEYSYDEVNTNADFAIKLLTPKDDEGVVLQGTTTITFNQFDHEVYKLT